MAKAKKPTKAKELIKIKFKKLANGNLSIFLEKYYGYKVTGILQDGNPKTQALRKYEFLNLYLIPEVTPANIALNKTTLQLANTIKAQRIVEMQTQNSGLPKRKKEERVNLIDFVLKIADKAFADTNNKRSEYYTYNSLAHHLKAYKGNKIDINDIDKAYVSGFIDYLKTAKNGNFDGQDKQPIISRNTAHKLFAKFSAVLKKALIDDIILINPIDKIDPKTKPKAIPSKREYLTTDEIKTLIATDCKRSDIKNAFLFCCLVGIRFKNVKNIKWGDIVTDSNGNTILSYKQIKVNTFETLPISNEAIRFLPIRVNQKLTDKVYHLPKNETVNDSLETWATAAKISKKITFHVSRHTAATLQLSLKTPIETVSKLLGHSKISTTQIYAKIIDESKKKAVNKQNGMFDKKTKTNKVKS
ncbi:MAG: site-specific integrase [Paludibacter sp.]|nr:site-specific integrase [Paludibacter sp.]